MSVCAYLALRHRLSYWTSPSSINPSRACGGPLQILEEKIRSTLVTATTTVSRRDKNDEGKNKERKKKKNWRSVGSAGWFVDRRTWQWIDYVCIIARNRRVTHCYLIVSSLIYRDRVKLFLKFLITYHRITLIFLTVLLSISRKLLHRRNDEIMKLL